MLKISKNERLIHDDIDVKSKDIDLAEYMIANLGAEVELEKGIMVEELVQLFYYLKDFVKNYFSEEYEVLRAMLTLGKFKERYKFLKIYKTLSVEDGYIYLMPNIELMVANDNEEGVDKVAELPVVLDDKVFTVDDLDIENIMSIAEENKDKIKTKFTLLDILTAFFDDLSDMLKNDSVLI